MIIYKAIKVFTKTSGFTRYICYLIKRYPEEIKEKNPFYKKCLFMLTYMAAITLYFPIVKLNFCSSCHLR